MATAIQHKQASVGTGGQSVTYTLGVPLREMRDPAAARARIPVMQKERTR